MMPRLIDHAAARVGAQACRAAGYDGAIRYLANSPDRGLPNKILTPDESRGYIDAGMILVSNWQKGKGPTADWRRGHAGGVDDAVKALGVHQQCGGPENRPIYFSVDEDVNLATWNSLVLPYLQGCTVVLGRDWVGVYGGQRSMWWAGEDGFRWRWQTKGWSRYDKAGNWNSSLPVQWVDGVQIRQERVDQDQINGIGIDVNTTWADDFGQWFPTSVPPVKEPIVGDPVWLPDVLRAEGLVCDIFPGAMQRGHGDFGQIWGVVAHHTGASGSPGPGAIANHPSLGLASQLHLDRSGKYTLCGVGIAWHAGQGSWPGIARDNANQVTIGIEAENNGTEGWSAAQYGAYVKGCAAILRKLGHDASRVIGHKEWAGPSQGKWDPGGIDMDAFRRDVQAVIDGNATPSQEDDMSWGEVIENLKGQPVSREDMVKWIDANVNDVLKQLGPWPQLGTNDEGKPLTLVDAVAQHGRDLAEIKELLAELAGKKG